MHARGCNGMLKGPGEGTFRQIGNAETFRGIDMKNGQVSFFVLAMPVLAVLFVGLREPVAKAFIYPAPGGVPMASDRTVQVDGQSVPVYDVPVNLNRVYNIATPTELAPMAYFDFSGSATVTVNAPGLTIASAAVRPASAAISHTTNGSQITFTLNQPAHLTVEFNGQVKRALHLFADSIETNPPKQGDANVRYFGPGVHTPNEMVVGSGQIIYIAGGAVVYGSIKGTGVNNFRLAGRGILHGGKYAREGDGPKNLINFSGGSSAIRLSGVILLDSPTWNVAIRQTRDVTVDDVKIIGARANSDGIDLVSCENVFVRRCFVRTWDDCMCVKSDAGINTRNVHFSKSVIWTDLAQSMEIGYETRSERISDISFTDIDVIHAFHKPVMSIHNGSQALVEGIRFEDIRVDDAQMGQGDGLNLLIELIIGSSVWTANDPRGRINGVSFKNINVLGGKLPLSRVWGFGAGNRIEGVTVHKMTLLGRPVRSKDDGQFAINTHVTPIVFTYPDISSVPGKAGRKIMKVPDIRFDDRGAMQFRPRRAGAYVLNLSDAKGRNMGTYRGKVAADGVIRTARLPVGSFLVAGDVGGEAFSGWVKVPERN